MTVRQQQRIRFFFWLVLMVFALPSLSWAQPNMEHVLHRVAARYPDVWRAAHRDYPQGPGSGTTKAQAELYVRIAAAEMNREHAGTEHAERWGVNGKRGNCDDLSQDVIQYRLAPNLNQGFDVIAAAGGPSPSVVWNPFPASTDAQGCFVPGVEVTQAEIDRIMGGGSPSNPTQPQVPTIELGEAATRVLDTFHRVHERAPEQVEIDAMAAYARANGWNGGLRIPTSVVESLVTLITRYSGDLNNPFPTVDATAAMLQINDAFFARFGRYMRAVERSALDAQARQRGYFGGPMQLWVLKELIALVNVYDGLYGAHLAQPVSNDAQLSVSGAGFALDGTRFQWRGQTAFLLFYDYIFNRTQYERFRNAAAWNKVNVLRTSVATGSAYLQLEPRSGGTFGLGRTTPLYPGSIPDFWGQYRAMLSDLAEHGILAEVVPFLTAGPPCNRGVCDFSVPQMHTEASRMAYLEETARELLPVRSMFLEIANEYNFIGFPDDGLEIVALAKRYKQIDPLRLVALSAPSGPGDTQNAHLMASGDYITVHADRRTDPWTFAWVVRQFGLPQLHYGKPLINDEGINADTVGEFGADADPRNHFINGVTTQLLHMSYTFHYDRALKGLEPSTIDGSKQAYDAWRGGLDLLDSDLPGQLYQASAAGVTPGFPFVSLGGAVAGAGRADEAGGVFVFYGTPAGFVVPAAPGWLVEQLADVQTHRVVRVTRIVH